MRLRHYVCSIITFIPSVFQSSFGVFSLVSLVLIAGAYGARGTPWPRLAHRRGRANAAAFSAANSGISFLYYSPLGYSLATSELRRTNKQVLPVVLYEHCLWLLYAPALTSWLVNWHYCGDDVDAGLLLVLVLSLLPKDTYCLHRWHRGSNIVHVWTMW